MTKEASKVNMIRLWNKFKKSTAKRFDSSCIILAEIWFPKLRFLSFMPTSFKQVPNFQPKPTIKNQILWFTILKTLLDPTCTHKQNQKPLV